MYRMAALARRLLSGATAGNSYLNIRTVIKGSRYCTAVNNNNNFPQSIFNQNQNQIPRANLEFPNQSEPTSSSNPTAEDGRRQQKRERPRIEYQEQQARVLDASLRHVLRLGWSEEAMIAGARDVGVSPSIVGSFPRQEAALVEFFMDECLQKLIDRIDSGNGEELQSLVPSERISKLLKIRLEMQAPYISKWPQALSIQAHPSNAPTSFKQRAMLVDEIWHAVDEVGSDIDWYVKRTVLGGIYSTTEIYMLTDSSPDFRDTWAFLDDRVKDAFDLKKTIQEAMYMAEAVGAGMGNSLQGFVRRVFQR